ncbi:MAG: hypothetical protein LQ350_000349 [Teloschistes chrysophthalmus]|nr:MAG: hypothetical protein LQ350_000349 [Niorma chrysophthalma]
MAGGAGSLNALLQRASIDDHDEILKACNASLKQSKKDLSAQHAKFVALLKLDRYEDALKVLESAGRDLVDQVQLEKSYALYKTGQLSEAASIAKAITDDRGARHVEAQASYRLEDFERSAVLYRELAKTHAALDSEENDLRINGAAIDAQLEWSKQGHLVPKKKATREDLEAFETAYNAACASIARGELSQGAVLLKRSQDLCNASSDLSEEEKAAELLPIHVQQCYVLSRLGNLEGAEAVASSISPKDIPDASTRAVAYNNSISASRNIENPYLAHRSIHDAAPIPNTDKLFTIQSDRIKENQLILDLLVSKFGGVIKSTSRTLAEKPSPTTTSHINNISVLNAAAHAQMRLGSFGIKHMLPLLVKRPLDVGLALVVVQLYILTNNHGSAVTVMESLLKHLEASTSSDVQDVRFAPGLVAAAVSLYNLQGRKTQITAEYAKAASYWRHKSKAPRSLLQAAGVALLESNKPEDQELAREIFATLHEQEPASKPAAAGYVAAHAFSSTPVANEAKALTPLSYFIAGIDVTALEAAGVPQAKSTADAALAASRKRALDEKPKPAKKRVRKSRMPKDYDPSKPADSERWLPLRERSSYRPKGKKGKQRAAGLTQGGVEKGGDGATAGSKAGEVVGKSMGAPGKSKNKKKTKK